MSERIPELEREAAILKDMMGAHGFCAIGFDFDDTLIYTHRVFSQHFREFRDRIAWMFPGLDMAEFKARFTEANDFVFHTYGVRTDRWSEVTSLLAQTYEDSEIREEIVRHGFLFDLIYQTVPQIKPGVTKTLDALQTAQVDMALITHANEEWTYFKLKETGLNKYFPNGRVAIVDEKGKKDQDGWNMALNSIGFQPQETIVVEDNLSSIRAARGLGVGMSVWVNYEEGWNIYRQGELPEGVTKIEEMDQLIGALIDNFN